MTADTDLNAIRQLIEKGVEAQERHAALLEAILEHLREGRTGVSTRKMTIKSMTEAQVK